MGAASVPVAVGPLSRGHPGLTWGLRAFIWLLPFHILVVAVLFGVLGWPMLVVRGIAAWKEATVALLVALTVLHVVTGRSPRGNVVATDLAVAGLGTLALSYLIGASAWFAADLPVGLQLLGWRDDVFFMLLYFVGRATPQVAEDFRYLRALFAVGVITSGIAILERIFVTPKMLVVLGAARYVQEFLGVAPATRNNEYGLPDNYWTGVGDHIVQRAGSTYLSSQSFAIPFLIILPAATLWLFRRERQRSVLAWLGYVILWTGLLLTVTRMTTVVCVLQVLALAAARRRWGIGVGGGLLAALGFALALLVVPALASFVWDTLTWQTGSSLSHLGAWSEGIQSLVQHPLGIGLGASGLTAVRFGLPPIAGDNQYFQYSVELGVPGLLLYVAILGGIGAAGLKAFRFAPGEPARSYGALTAAAALGLALNGITTVALTLPFVSYIFFWLAGSTVALADGRTVSPRGGA